MNMTIVYLPYIFEFDCVNTLDWQFECEICWSAIILNEFFLSCLTLETPRPVPFSSIESKKLSGTIIDIVLSFLATGQLSMAELLTLLTLSQKKSLRNLWGRRGVQIVPTMFFVTVTLFFDIHWQMKYPCLYKNVFYLIILFMPSSDLYCPTYAIRS